MSYPETSSDRSAAPIATHLHFLSEAVAMFAPIVTLVRSQMGKVKLSQLRGKAISLHCQTVTNICNWLGMDVKQRQDLIRTAKSSNKTLGLLV